MSQVVQQSISDKQKYIPGVCNIGPAERAKRRQTGIIAVIVTIVLLVTLVASGVSVYWRLIIFLPASVAATGLLQDAFHFCVGFGIKGLYNVVNSAGITNNVESEEFRLKDRHKAQMIIRLSVAIGAVIAGLSLL